eukprot:scaffold11.g3854.t1
MELALRVLREGAAEGGPPPFVLWEAAADAPAPHLLLLKAVAELAAAVAAGTAHAAGVALLALQHPAAEYERALVGAGLSPATVVDGFSDPWGWWAGREEEKERQAQQQQGQQRHAGQPGGGPGCAILAPLDGLALLHQVLGGAARHCIVIDSLTPLLDAHGAAAVAAALRAARAAPGTAVPSGLLCCLDPGAAGAQAAAALESLASGVVRLSPCAAPLTAPPGARGAAEAAQGRAWGRLEARFKRRMGRVRTQAQRYSADAAGGVDWAPDETADPAAAAAAAAAPPAPAAALQKQLAGGMRLELSEHEAAARQAVRLPYEHGGAGAAYAPGADFRDYLPPEAGGTAPAGHILYARDSDSEPDSDEEVDQDLDLFKDKQNEGRRPMLALSFGVCGLELTLPLLSAPAPARPVTPPPAPGAELAPELAALRAAADALRPGWAAELEGTGEAPSDALLTRWLAARCGDGAAAAAGLVEHAAWRAAFYGHAAPRGIPEESIREELAAGKVLLQGLDYGGHPVVVIRAARHDMRARDLAQTKRLISYVLDNACATADAARNPFGQLTCVLDLSGLRPRNLDYRALLAIFELLQGHHPERLHRLYFFNGEPPFIFFSIWRLVSPFVHPATRAKLAFASGAAGARLLRAEAPPHVLPRECGGAADPVPVEAAVAAWRAESAAAAAAAGGARAARAAGAGAEAGGAGWAPRRQLEGLRARVGGAGRAAGGVLRDRVWRPARGAAAAVGARLPLRWRPGSPAGGERVAQQQQRALQLGLQVVLSQVLLIGLLLSVLRRLLATSRRHQQQQPGQAGAAGEAAPGRAAEGQAAAPEAAAGGAEGEQAARGGAGGGTAPQPRRDEALAAAAAAAPVGPLAQEP